MPKINARGQTLIEVIVAIGAGTLVIAALAFATISSLRNAQLAQNQAQATKLAQEGLEGVRTARDRNACVASAFGSSSGVPPCTTGYSWNDPAGLWATQYNSQCGEASNNHCYFRFDYSNPLPDRRQDLIAIGNGANPPASNTEQINNSQFTRVVIISDDTNYQSEKRISVVVNWTDFSGQHESKLTTVLRNPNL